MLFATAYDAGSHVGRRNWFQRQIVYRNPTRQSRQVFAFPDGESQGFGQNGRSRQLGNGRGFTWGSGNNNNNNNIRRRLPTQNDIRPIVEDVEEDDRFVFDQGDNNQDFSEFGRQTSSTRRTPTSTVAVPGMGTTRSPCEDACLTTPEYNPVCGDDGLTYFSRARLRCAQKCGKSKWEDVSI